MPRFSCRCLVLLLLAAVATGLLARPAEAVKRPFADVVNAAARRHGVDPGLVHAVIAVESGYRANAQSPAGAQGLMQLMPGTQRQLGVSDAFDPQQNVDAGVAYLRRLTPPPFRGDYRIELPNDMNRTDLPNAPRRLIGRERGRHALGERLPGLPRPQPIWIRERPLQPVARRRVGQVVQLGTRASG